MVTAFVRAAWSGYIPAADNKIHCPTCRVEVNVPQAGVAGLPKNFALLDIINANVTPQNNGDESSYICEFCEDKQAFAA